jgi:hypothetical protein
MSEMQMKRIEKMIRNFHKEDNKRNGNKEKQLPPKK